MGNLVLKTVKTTKVYKGSDDYITYSENSGDTEQYNPSEGYVQLKPFDFSFSTGKKANKRDNLSREMPRVSVGSKNSVPISFNCTMSKRDKTNYIPADLIKSMLYLYKASESDYVSLLYWIPNGDNDITSGQDKMYYQSIFNIIQNTKWSEAIITKANSGYNGSYNYEPYVIPIKITGMTTKETAGQNTYTVSIQAELLVQEND